MEDEDVLKTNSLSKTIKILSSNTRLKSLIEFSRSVHAEMHAIINATQKSGSQIINGKLYCTTYPCHNCARHIVAAGISEVYYIEPYQKSLALKLHSDSITEDESVSKKVKLLIYDGVSPNRYNDLFQMVNKDERKINGELKKNKRQEATPKSRKSIDAIPYLEQKVHNELINTEDLSILLKQI